MNIKLYFSIIFFSLFLSVFEKTDAQSPDWLWARGIGGTEFDAISSLVTDVSGNVYSTGFYNGVVDFDPGAGVYVLSWGGLFISKLDPSGNFIWAKSIGTFGCWVSSNSIAIDALNNIYITGTFSGTVDFDPDSIGTFYLTSTNSADIFISKFDSSGNFVWAHGIGGTGYDYGLSITLNASGDVFTSGAFQDIVDFDPDTGTYDLASAGTYDIFISKLDNSGNFIWAKRIGGAGEDIGNSLTTDFTGHVYTTGFFSDTIDFDPGPGVFLLGGNSRIFISKLDASGNFVWAKEMGGTTGIGQGISIALDASENVYTTGAFLGPVDFDPGALGIFNLNSAGQVDIFISKLDNAGNFIWAKSIGGTDEDIGYSIALDPGGNVYITGSFRETVDFNPNAGNYDLTSVGLSDVFVCKLDSSGNFSWAKSVGGDSYDYASSLAVGALTNVHVGGYFTSATMAFGSTICSNVDSSGFSKDLFIAKLDQTVTGIESVENNYDIFVYPSPATNELSVNLTPVLINREVSDVVVYNLFGKMISNCQLSTNNKQLTLDVSQLAAGIYFVKVSGKDFSVVRKFVKQ